jgi:hypothetical protein
LGRHFSEKDFDDRNTRGNSIGDACFARTIGAATGDARHQFEKCDEYSPCAAPPQAHQEFAPREAAPGFKAAQPANLTVTQLELRDLAETRKLILCTKRRRLSLRCKTGSQAAPRFCYFRFVALAARALPREFRVSDAHRMRGVIS